MANATSAAEAARGRLDRARLLAGDPGFVERLHRWRTVPSRLDGTGARVAQLADDLVAPPTSRSRSCVAARLTRWPCFRRRPNGGVRRSSRGTPRWTPGTNGSSAVCAQTSCRRGARRSLVGIPGAPRRVRCFDTAAADDSGRHGRHRRSRHTPEPQRQRDDAPAVVAPAPRHLTAAGLHIPRRGHLGVPLRQRRRTRARPLSSLAHLPEHLT